MARHAADTSPTAELERLREPAAEPPRGGRRRLAEPDAELALALADLAVVPTDLDVAALDAAPEAPETAAAVSPVVTDKAVTASSAVRRSARFTFDGDVAGCLRTHVVAALVTVLSLGFLFPWGLVTVQQWKAHHLSVGGRRLVFSGDSRDLLGRWVAWWLLTLGTVGIYGFWVYGKVSRWVWDNTDYEAVWQIESESATAYLNRPLAPPSRLHLAFFTEAGRHQVG